MTNTNLKIGSVVNIAGIDWIILDKLEGNHYFFQDYVLCLSKDVLYDIQFSKDSTDYNKSNIRARLKEDFLPKLTIAVGEDNMLDTEINLISGDKSTNYGIITDKVGLLTKDVYVKYRDIIKQYPTAWWWLSTPVGSDNDLVGSVFNDCTICGAYRELTLGVRPFVKFNPKIFNL